MKKNSSYDDRFISYNEVNWKDKENGRNGPNLDLNKLIKALGGHDHAYSHNNIDGSISQEKKRNSMENAFHLDQDLTHQNEEDEMAIVDRVLPPFPQKKIVGTY